ncbi:hypothetical protein [Sphingobacterium sp. SYP-B4668]|uniref:hypothetical protein n=1 Tax=Sphingobacterium sp. SYP-B4668 TaxID=2996035 RepID=UPI0022DDB678|nr:hypothetical protein [Sphingobacterium sp. SYP-B4668]
MGMLAACAQPSGQGPVGSDNEGWQEEIRAELPLLGHRNWILIVDKAYPAPNNPDITVINTGASMIDVVRGVDSMLRGQSHIRPIVYQDAEFNYLDEGLVGGIEAYRKDIKALWGGRTVQEIPHGEIFKKIDEASQLFKVVVLKTESLLPYTSVFLELDCGYWDAKREETLRSRLNK